MEKRLEQEFMYVPGCDLAVWEPGHSLVQVAGTPAQQVLAM